MSSDSVYIYGPFIYCILPIQNRHILKMLYIKQFLYHDACNDVILFKDLRVICTDNHTACIGMGFYSQIKKSGDDHRRQNEYQEKLLDATWANMWKNHTHMTYVLEQFAEEEKSNENKLVEPGMSDLHNEWTNGWTAYDDWLDKTGDELAKKLKTTEKHFR